VLWGTLKEGHMHPAPSEKHPSKIPADKSKGAGKRAISEPHGKHRDVQRLRGAIRDEGADKTQIRVTSYSVEGLYAMLRDTARRDKACWRAQVRIAGGGEPPDDGDRD
jgi:hypothetical protein